LKDKLRPFQKSGVQWLEEKHGVGLLADEMGLGKSCQAITYLYLNPELRPALVICPASIKINWQREIIKWANEESIILYGKKATHINKSNWYIINYDVLAEEIKIDTKKKVLADTSWIYKLASLGIKAIIIDECFSYDTLIWTDKGLLKIGDIVENKIQVNIFCTNSLGYLDIMPIKHYIKNVRHNRMVSMKHSYGEIVCTENHLFWSKTNGKWEKISEIKSGEDLYFLQEEVSDYEKRERNGKILQPSLRNELSNVNSRKYRKITWRKSKADKNDMSLLQKIIFSTTKCCKKKNILLSILHGEKSLGNQEYERNNAFSRIIGKCKNKNEKILQFGRGNTSKKEIIRENDKEQSCTKSRNNAKNIGHKKENRFNRLFEILSRWKWVFNRATIKIEKTPERWLGIRICDTNKNERISWNETSLLLQSRYRKSKTENSNRSGRRKSQNKKDERKRLFENKSIRITRVESITFLELGYNGKSEENSNYDFVYDLEIDKYHNYFANGILVHNCQAIVNPSAIRSKAIITLKKILPSVQFIALSGTPIKNRPREFFTILNLLAPKVFPNRWRYLHKYCGPKYNGFGWTFDGATNIDQLQELIKPLMLRRTKDEVLKDLPPKQRIIIPLETDKVALKNYEDATEQFRIWAKDHIDKGLDLQINIDRLKQLAYLAKRNSVIKWLEEYPENKLVVATYHKNTLEDLYNYFKKESVYIDGSITGDKRQKSIDTFQKDNKIKFIFLQILCAPGMTLTSANATCTIEFAWSPSDHFQLEDRVHRLTQEADSVFAYYLIATKTIEEDIISLIDSKQIVLGKLLDGKENSKIFDQNDIVKILLKILKDNI
jgi:intein/homing endonuclease